MPRVLLTERKQMGQRLRTCREAAGLTQVQLGQRLGVSFQMIQKYEAGRSQLGLAHLSKLAEALGVPIAFLLQWLCHTPKA